MMQKMGKSDLFLDTFLFLVSHESYNIMECYMGMAPFLLWWDKNCNIPNYSCSKQGKNILASVVYLVFSCGKIIIHGLMLSFWITWIVAKSIWWVKIYKHKSLCIRQLKEQSVSFQRCRQLAIPCRTTE